MKDDVIKKSYMATFDIEDKALKDLIIINTKCLVDDVTQRYVYIDNNRLKDELIYYRYYNDKLEYNTILSILTPIILANTNIEKSEEEVVSLIRKYVKYLKKEEYLFDYLLGSVIYNSMIHYILENKNIEYEKLLQSIKSKIIGFSIDLDKLSTIKFQMARINTIQQIDKYIDLKIENYDDNKIVTTLLNIIYDIYIENREIENQGIKSIKKSILSILGEDENLNIENIDFILSMSEYVTKIRKYKINKKIYNQISDPKKLIGLNSGDSIIDPILNQITIISKDFSDNILKIKIKSRTGNYTLKFKKS
ncbi:MAG: hypothetical protein RRZ84_02040 [Romboutsia sp.]